jgi:hypothetical protein
MTDWIMILNHIFQSFRLTSDSEGIGHNLPGISQSRFWRIPPNCKKKKYLEEHGTNSYSHKTEQNPFASKIICGNFGKIFNRKGWQSGYEYRKVWQCSERYKVKGVIGCNNRHADEATLEKAYVMSWNAILDNKEHFIEKWKSQSQGDDLLLAYRAKKFITLVQNVEPIEAMETDFMLKTLDHIKIFENGLLLVVFIDGTEIECKNEEKQQ